MSSSQSYYSRFIHQYPIRKTLCFSLIPQGRTQEHIDAHGFISEDEQRASDYEKLKHLIDGYHKYFIEETLKNIASNKYTLDWGSLFTAYAALEKAGLEEKAAARKNYQKIQEFYRKELADRFKTQELDGEAVYKNLSMEDLIEKLLPSFYRDDNSALDTLKRYKGFTSSLQGLHQNRMNMYSDEAKATGIPNRIVNDNFPRYASNCIKWKQLIDANPEIAAKLQDSISAIRSDVSVSDYFIPDNYSLVIDQKGIETYNLVIGGFVLKNGEKIQGLNELANQLYQQAGKDQRKFVFKQLYKQILIDETNSSEIEHAQFLCDGDLVDAYETAIDCLIGDKTGNGTIENAIELLRSMHSYDLNEVKVKRSNLRLYSQICFDSPFYILDAIAWFADNQIGFLKEKKKKNIEAWRGKACFSLYELAQVVSSFAGADPTNKEPELNSSDSQEVLSVLKYDSYLSILNEIRDEFAKNENAASQKLDSLDRKAKKLIAGHDATAQLKAALDTLLELSHNILIFSVSEEEGSSSFYAQYDEYAPYLRSVSVLYDKARNYVTQKPYSTEKYKLSFEKPTFLSGWDEDKVNDRRGIIIKEDNRYYLGIPTGKEVFAELLESQSADSDVQVMRYKQFSKPSWMIPKCSTAVKEVQEHFSLSDDDFLFNPSRHKQFVRELAISKEIFGMNWEKRNGEYVKREQRPYQKGYLQDTGDSSGHLKALSQWINFCLDFLESYKSTSIYDFSQCRTKKYDSLQQFYKEIDSLTYAVDFVSIGKATLSSLVDKGSLLLFQIFNKDFSSKSTGVKNLHTLYFEALFDERNLQDVIFKLNGGAEMFYRPASIDNPFVHQAGEYVVRRTIKEKTEKGIFTVSIPDSIHAELYEWVNGRLPDKTLSLQAKEIIEAYPQIGKKITHQIVKDKRYSKAQYSLHMPITINFKARTIKDNEMNSEVLACVSKDPNINIIGIDRGERNLLYFSVINNKGEILDQGSLNTIKGVDYQAKLDVREKERNKQRKSWKSIKGIANLKKGYLSAAVHQITSLMLKHNAVLVMEDLNRGFKRSRVKFEKQVYQNFEKQVLDKLNYLAAKDNIVDPGEPGGIMHGYQLANPFKSFDKLGKQSGAVFYVPAWNTSHIDPTTGFVNLFKNLKYESVDRAKCFFGKMKSVRFNPESDYFEFSFSYSDFETTAKSYKDDWTVCSHSGPRLLQVRNESARGSKQYVDQWVDINEGLGLLFCDAGINYQSGQSLLPAILDNTSKSFFSSLVFYFKSLLKMRYSSSAGAPEQIDCIVSPVKNMSGDFFDTRKIENGYPRDADANGAYHIALKGLQMFQERITKKGDYLLVDNAGAKEDWLEFMQAQKWRS